MRSFRDIPGALLSIPIAALAYLPYGLLRNAAVSTNYSAAALTAAAIAFVVDAGTRVDALFIHVSSTSGLAIPIVWFYLCVYSGILWSVMKVIHEIARIQKL